MVALKRLQKEKAEVLLQDMPTFGKRFNFKLKYLLSPEQKRVYYSQLADILIEACLEYKSNTSHGK
jgi:hypothetical protein